MAYKNGQYYLNVKMQNGGKERYELRLVKIVSRHPDGTPKDLELLLNTKKYDVTDRPEFMTCLVPTKMMGNEGAG